MYLIMDCDIDHLCAMCFKQIDVILLLHDDNYEVFLLQNVLYCVVLSVCVCLSACTAQYVPVSNSITVLGSSVAGNPHHGSSIYFILYYYYIVIWICYDYVLCANMISVTFQDFVRVQFSCCI